MQGTAKQIKWAEAIKAEKMPVLEKFEDRLNEVLEEHKDNADIKAKLTKYFEVVAAIKAAENASFWIDSREFNFANAYLYDDVLFGWHKSGYIK